MLGKNEMLNARKKLNVEKQSSKSLDGYIYQKENIDKTGRTISKANVIHLTITNVKQKSQRYMRKSVPGLVLLPQINCFYSFFELFLHALGRTERKKLLEREVSMK